MVIKMNAYIFTFWLITSFWNCLISGWTFSKAYDDEVTENLPIWDFYLRSIYPTIRLELAGVYGLLLFCGTFKKFHFSRTFRSPGTNTNVFWGMVAYFVVFIAMVYYFVDTILHLWIYILNQSDQISPESRDRHYRFGDIIAYQGCPASAVLLIDFLLASVSLGILMSPKTNQVSASVDSSMLTVSRSNWL